MNIRDEQIFAAIVNAVYSGDTRATVRLLSASPDELFSQRYIAGGTLLHLAAGRGDLQLVKALVALGADINFPSGLEGEFAICRACSSGHIDIVRYLISCGATLDVSSSTRNPIFSSISGGFPEIVEMLVAAGIDLRPRYNMSYGDSIDAVAFSTLWGESDSARFIARAAAAGDYSREDELIKNASRLVARLAGA